MDSRWILILRIRTVHGIGMVHQEFMLMEDYSVAENIKLNKENTKKECIKQTF